MVSRNQEQEKQGLGKPSANNHKDTGQIYHHQCRPRKRCKMSSSGNLQVKMSSKQRDLGQKMTKKIVLNVSVAW